MSHYNMRTHEDELKRKCFLCIVKLRLFLKNKVGKIDPHFGAFLIGARWILWPTRHYGLRWPFIVSYPTRARGNIVNYTIVSLQTNQRTGLLHMRIKCISDVSVCVITFSNLGHAVEHFSRHQRPRQMLITTLPHEERHFSHIA